MSGKRLDRRQRIKKGIRKSINGSGTTPRLSVFRSNKAIYAQLVDDSKGNTLVSCSSRELGSSSSTIEVSSKVGKELAKKAADKGIEKVVFDRGGYLYHGKVKALADGAREGGLNSRIMSEVNIRSVKASEIDLKENVVAIKRVAKVVKGGRRFSFSAIVVVGDGNGVVGYGLGKANEVTDAITKGIDDAKKNLIRIPVINNTVPHESLGKYSGGLVLVKPASPGTGVIAGGAMRAVLESAGIRDVLAKSKGSSNPHNVVKATFDALLRMRDPYTVAQQRGISLSKVFSGQD